MPAGMQLIIRRASLSCSEGFGWQRLRMSPLHRRNSANKRAGDTLMCAYIAVRRTDIQLLVKGVPYGRVNQIVYVATRYFEQQFRAQSQRPQR